METQDGFIENKMKTNAKRFSSGIRQKGFTVVELMITVAVLAMILAIAAPSLTDFSQRQAIRGDIDRFSKLLTTARSLAMTTDTASSVVCWNTTNTDATISGVPVSALTIAVYSGSIGALDDLEVTQALEGSSTVYRASEADGCIGFDSQGRLDETAASTVAFTVCKKAGDSQDSKRVEVASTGRVLTRPNDSTRGAGVQSCN